MSGSSGDAAAASESELKAGHPPAVKVGGMRVVQHCKKDGAEKSEAPAMTAEEEAEYGASPPKTDKHNQAQLVSGAITKGDKDFSAQALKSFHEKPQPQHDKPRPVQAPHNIHQPR